MSQPVPDVTAADVARILRRDFDPDAAEEIAAELHRCDPPLSPRATLAVLKLASGSRESARQHIETARRDWRDVVAYAEYPSYMRTVRDPDTMTARELAAVHRADWAQYEQWLVR